MTDSLNCDIVSKGSRDSFGSFGSSFVNLQSKIHNLKSNLFLLFSGRGEFPHILDKIIRENPTKFVGRSKLPFLR
jgi:hypothetical protein